MSAAAASATGTVAGVGGPIADAAASAAGIAAGGTGCPPMGCVGTSSIGTAEGTGACPGGVGSWSAFRVAAIDAIVGRRFGLVASIS